MLYTAPLANVKLAEFRYGKYWPLIGQDGTRALDSDWLIFRQRGDSGSVRQDQGAA